MALVVACGPADVPGAGPGRGAGLRGVPGGGPRAVRTESFARRVGTLSGQALRSLRCPLCRRWEFCSIRGWLSACRRRVTRLMVRFPPRLVAVRPRREVVRPPKCRPIGQQQSKIGHFEAMGLHFGGFGVNIGVLFAREPLNMHVNPLIRTSTPRYAPGRRCPRACHRVNVRVKGFACSGCVHRNRRGPDGPQASRRSLYAQGDDGGGTSKGPTSRCVR